MIYFQQIVYFFFNRMLFRTTEIELTAIAILAITGESNMPVAGKSIPAAIGIASTL